MYYRPPLIAHDIFLTATDNSPHSTEKLWVDSRTNSSCTIINKAVQVRARNQKGTMSSSQPDRAVEGKCFHSRWWAGANYS
ncbi:hypothetical protein M378DRAFT_481618 [Amanita muscaria Koide BX008]|uniref:Uncharacterized protein n=1 Tax=Amanita muscaria (strain Koide BX008) TaxID=946122 RepID=A0A0C2TTT0_AMAMK|nr:hypothetical protein M378DRAFT_481618 [Amanita muscaria Koide BX008]